MKPYFGFRGERLSYAIGIIAGCDFLLFGYGKTSPCQVPISTGVLTVLQIKALWAAS